MLIYTNYGHLIMRGLSNKRYMYIYMYVDDMIKKMYSYMSYIIYMYK